MKGTGGVQWYKEERQQDMGSFFNVGKLNHFSQGVPKSWNREGGSLWGKKSSLGIRRRGGNDMPVLRLGKKGGLLGR